MSDDFVMTIDDDDTIVTEDFLDNTAESTHESEEEERAVESKKGKKNKKNKKGNKADKKRKASEVEEEFNSEFSFAIDGGGSKVFKGWDFTAAKDMLKTKQIERVSIDDIIAKKRQENKKAKKATIENQKAEEFVASDDDNDDDLALDGFGGGAEKIIEEDSSDSSDSNEESSDEESGEDIDAGSDEEELEDEAEKQRKKEFFADESEIDKQEHVSFTSMNLSRPILRGITGLGFVKPTTIQSQTIPIALMGKDICGGAATGSGKTAAFVIPIIERLLYRPRQTPSTRVLILCPTRELAAQVHSAAVKFASYTDITFCLCVGGLSLKTQEQELKLKPDVVVATPGRLIDHVRNTSGFHLDACEILVMDEADRMLEDGFADELGEIIKSCPKSRQTMLFSATMTDNVDQLIRMSLNNPARLFVDKSNQAASRLVQEFVRIRQAREADRAAVLLTLCKKSFKKRVIVFFRSKAAAHQMKILFGLMGLTAAELHGNLSQEQRLDALEQFRDGEVEYLLATDLAARGLDIKGIETVINYNMPTQFAQYLHRVGRTARAGRNGRSVTLVGEADRKMLKMAVKSSAAGAQVKNRVVPNEIVQKFKIKVEKSQQHIKDILEEEKQEKAIKNAEMQLKRSENIIKHQDEIMSRPARTWFQTETEKKKSKEVKEDKEKDKKDKKEKKDKKDKYEGMSRRKRRRLQAMEEEEEERRQNAK
ncbi:P-loop containing nucleoside triphosphate hydrolase protein [Sporodiniella umbellata]|nr:P-loop containing nucleoside triphosphate hydrolase protein [Sporodiniella umbellata]